MLTVQLSNWDIAMNLVLVSMFGCEPYGVVVDEVGVLGKIVVE